MKSKLLALVSILALTTMISGCSLFKQANPDSTTVPPVVFQIPANYTTYSDDVGLFKVSYPGDWTVDLSVLQDPAVAEAVDRIKTGATDYEGKSLFFAGLAEPTGYRPNFNISVSPVPSGYSYDRLLTAEINGLKKSLDSYVQHSVTGTTIDGKRASIIDCEGSFDAITQTDIGTVHDLFMFTIVNGNEWIISCTSFDDSFSQWSADFDNIVRSLKVTG